MSTKGIRSCCLIAVPFSLLVWVIVGGIGWALYTVLYPLAVKLATGG